jgi:hypothetical protein
VKDVADVATVSDGHDDKRVFVEDFQHNGNSVSEDDADGLALLPTSTRKTHAHCQLLLELTRVASTN